MLKGFAEMHKRLFEGYWAESEVFILVRQPAAKTAATNDVDKLKGATSFETAVGTTQLIKVLWSNDLLRPEAVLPGDVSEPIAALGDGERLDAVVRLPLSEALLDADNPQGATVFDTARDITYSGRLYEIKGTKRTGLMPIGPYILWVGLKLVAEER